MLLSYLLERKAFYKKVFKGILYLLLNVAIIMFAFINILVGVHKMTGWEDLFTLVRICGAATLIAVGIFGLFLLVEIADGLLQRKIQWNWQYARVSAGALALVVILASCQTTVLKGVKKNLNTGMVTAYTQLEPSQTLIRMNNETLNHTDIPLGEKFEIINENIKGFHLKDGKARVGCSLTITDERDSVLLRAEDLFSGNDEYDLAKANTLRCTVTTGEPMKWEEKYNVAVVFWDKQGDGRIENKVKIRMIDIP